MDFLDRTEERGRLTRLLDGRSGGRMPVHVLAQSWRKVSRRWGADTNRQPMELDVVAESPDGETLLVGEAKLSLTKAEAARARAELNAKAALLPFAKSYKRVVTKLFVYEKGEL